MERVKHRNRSSSGKKYQFETSCINAPSGEVIIKMADQATPITYDTFMSYVNREDIVNMFPDYEWGRSKGLRLKNDPIPGYYKSIYMGKPCVYIKWSGIEFIFINER